MLDFGRSNAERQGAKRAMGCVEGNMNDYEDLILQTYWRCVNHHKRMLYPEAVRSQCYVLGGKGTGWRLTVKPCSGPMTCTIPTIKSAIKLEDEQICIP